MPEAINPLKSDIMTVGITAGYLAGDNIGEIPKGTKRARLTVQTATIRYSDGTTTVVGATGTEVGNPLYVGDCLDLTDDKNWQSVLEKIRVIRDTTTDGALWMEFFT